MIKSNAIEKLCFRKILISFITSGELGASFISVDTDFRIEKDKNIFKYKKYVIIVIGKKFKSYYYQI